MATFSVVLLIILIGIGLCASSDRSDEQQNQNKCENQNALAGEMSRIEAKLEQIENGMRENQNAFNEKMAGIEAKLEKLIENGMLNSQKTPSLMKNMANSTLFDFNSLPIYRWNASVCDPGIVINESTNAIQRNATGTEGEVRLSSCHAEPGRIGIIYTEYRILADKGPRRVSFGYAQYGLIKSEKAYRYRNYRDNVPSFCIGDVVGCGLNWATRQVFYTKNGQRLNITNLYVDEGTADVYPTVSLSHHGDAVEANFGPNFKYDLSKEF
ncbi:hypothetical protein niasHT_034812 [Heterodera trifolii]|uniref:SPRY domain-containing protein n=1 Tax=Heterodera trifolii TaxID=157864 RepID=A0ABD2IAC9_9BILA